MQFSLTSIEECLHDYAKEFTPPGTSIKSVIHQWLFSIVYERTPFAEHRGVDLDEVKQILRDAEYFNNENEFKESLINLINIKPPQDPEFTFIDLFAGIGGMRQGFESANGLCVFSSEFEKNAQNTYEANFGEYPFGDITKISETDIPPHDVLVAGFPCQPFSHAGLKLGVDDTRGTLFYDIARIMEQRRPRVALLENVKGLISHDKGHTLSVILETLINIGYKCVIDNELIFSGNIKKIKEAARQMVLKSRDFGVPQNRQRIYIVLWREDLNLDFIYPEPTGEKTRVGDILETKPNEKYTISDRLWEGHQRRKKQNKLNGKGFGYGMVTTESEYTNTISARYYKDGSEVLVYQGDRNPRKITPKEALKLQGFPNDFIRNQSDVQAYKQFGNSVSVPVVKTIALEIKKQLLR